MVEQLEEQEIRIEIPEQWENNIENLQINVAIADEIKRLNEALAAQQNNEEDYDSTQYEENSRRYADLQPLNDQENIPELTVALVKESNMCKSSKMLTDAIAAGHKDASTDEQLSVLDLLTSEI